MYSQLFPIILFSLSLPSNINDNWKCMEMHGILGRLMTHDLSINFEAKHFLISCGCGYHNHLDLLNKRKGTGFSHAMVEICIIC